MNINYKDMNVFIFMIVFLILYCYLNPFNLIVDTKAQVYIIFVYFLIICIFI